MNRAMKTNVTMTTHTYGKNSAAWGGIVTPKQKHSVAQQAKKVVAIAENLRRRLLDAAALQGKGGTSLPQGGVYGLRQEDVDDMVRPVTPENRTVGVYKVENANKTGKEMMMFVDKAKQSLHRKKMPQAVSEWFEDAGEGMMAKSNIKPVWMRLGAEKKEDTERAFPVTGKERYRSALEHVSYLTNQSAIRKN